MLPELFLVAVEAVDEELRAVPPGLFLGVDRLQVGRVLLVLFGNFDLLPADAGVEAVEYHGDPQSTCIDDPGFAQHGEQFRGAADRLVGGLPRRPDNRKQVGIPCIDGLSGRPGRVLDHIQHRALAPSSPAAKASASRESRSARTSQAPRIICDRMTPEFPLAPMSAALAHALLASSGLA